MIRVNGVGDVEGLGRGFRWFFSRDEVKEVTGFREIIPHRGEIKSLTCAVVVGDDDWSLSDE